MLRNDRERRGRNSFTGVDVGDMGGSDSIGCCGCRVMMAGDRRADTPSIENLLGRVIGVEGEVALREGGCPGVKEAG